LAEQVLKDWKEGDEKIKKLDAKDKRNYPFERIWLVGENGKKQARQVIPKEKCSKSKK